MKKSLLDDFNGYVWGWIVENGTRQAVCLPGGPKYEDIVGIWGRVIREGIAEPFYCESFLCEYATAKRGEGSWKDSPLAMLQEINREQTLRGAYHQQLINETVKVPETVVLRLKRSQLWKCGECSHTFYTEVGSRAVWYKAVCRWVVRLVRNRPELAECTTCKKVAAKKIKIVSKEPRD